MADAQNEAPKTPKITPAQIVCNVVGCGLSEAESMLARIPVERQVINSIVTLYEAGDRQGILDAIASPPAPEAKPDATTATESAGTTSQTKPAADVRKSGRGKTTNQPIAPTDPVAP